MTSYAVIGSGYGDEGKGRTVDYLCATQGVDWVVRYSGGAQAGHTVQIEGDGPRHVFHHFGSGSFRGVPTYLGKNFIVNPLVYVKESRELEKKLDGTVLTIAASRHCRVTTWIDMLLNEMIETQRGPDRHGSTGMGINETVMRHSSGYSLALRDLMGPALEMKVDEILNDYLPLRLAELEIDPLLHSQRMEYIKSDRIKQAWLDDAKKMMTSLGIGEGIGGDVVYEGSQGLLLDQSYTEFQPHLTSSSVGSRGILEMVKNDVSPSPEMLFYCTRPYMTRHGAGPFPTEDATMSVLSDLDSTNVPNEWQGTLRFGKLDISRMRDAQDEDYAIWEDSDFNDPIPWISLTCMDHLFREREGEDVDVLRERVGDMGADIGLESWGPSFDKTEAMI